jgi:hypothetical protein
MKYDIIVRIAENCVGSKNPLKLFNQDERYRNTQHVGIVLN